MSDCKVCAFKNPKATATAVIIRDNALLLLKRNEEPYKGMLDLPGGYLDAGECAGDAIVREIKEELGIDVEHRKRMFELPGVAEWEGETFPIVSTFFLVDIGDQEIDLNEENSEAVWIPLKNINPEEVAFDSNQGAVRRLKDAFTYDMGEVRALVSQLDDSAYVDEQALYRAQIDGYLAKVHEGDKLVGMGWAFPRQTMLRRQAVVEDMIVDSSQRGKGRGRAILQMLIQECKNNDMEMMELTTNPKREAANGLYKSEGFWLHDTNHYLLDLTK